MAVVRTKQKIFILTDTPSKSGYADGINRNLKQKRKKRKGVYLHYNRLFFMGYVVPWFDSGDERVNKPLAKILSFNVDLNILIDW